MMDFLVLHKKGLNLKFNVAILGGSFNPITKSHIEIAEKCYEYGDFDKIWLSPCYNNRFKSNLISSNHRINMCKLAIESVKNFVIVSEYEINNKIKDGTYCYLNKLKEDYKDFNFSYIIGADQANKIKEWINYHKLVEEFEFVIFNRVHNGVSLINKLDYSKTFKKYMIINQPISPFSSTLFRNNFEKNNYNFCSKIIDEKVLKYIFENNLYRRGNRCSKCFWALYDGDWCQNPVCEMSGKSVGENRIYLSNYEALNLINGSKSIMV
jgi:nicotinate (nicotinamide) nucleotide adenylyltransferase